MARIEFWEGDTLKAIKEVGAEGVFPPVRVNGGWHKAGTEVGFYLNGRETNVIVTGFDRARGEAFVQARGGKDFQVRIEDLEPRFTSVAPPVPPPVPTKVTQWGNNTLDMYSKKPKLPYRWRSYHRGDYHWRDDFNIRVDLKSPRLQAAVEESIEAIKSATGYSPDMVRGNPALKRSIYESYIKDVVRRFESKVHGKDYGAARDARVAESGGVVTVGRIIQNEEAVCLELSILGHVVFSEFGFKTNLVTGKLDVQSTSSPHAYHAWLRDLDEDIIIDSNNYGAMYQSVTNDRNYRRVLRVVNILQEDILVRPR